MALSFTAENQTASPVALTDLGKTVPASGSLLLTDDLLISELRSSIDLQDAVQADEILLNDGTGTLSKSESLAVIARVQQTTGRSASVSDTVTAATTSTSLTNIPSMSLVIPEDGTYLAFLSCRGSTGGNNQVFIGIALDGTPLTATLRSEGNSGFFAPTSAAAIAAHAPFTATAGQTLTAQYASGSGGSISVTDRVLTWLRVV